MAIQLRRGAYTALDPDMFVAGEVAIVLEGDPGLYLPTLQQEPIAGDGTGVYVCIEPGVLERLVSATELNAVVQLLGSQEPVIEK